MNIALFISAIAIPTKRPWTVKRYIQEIEPLNTEIQHDGNEYIEDKLIPLIRNEIAEMKNLEFILKLHYGNVYLNDTDEYANYNDTYGSYESYGLSGIKSDINGNGIPKWNTDEYKNYYYWALNSVEKQLVEVITCFRGRVQNSGDFSGDYFDFREERNMDSNGLFVAFLVFVMVVNFSITMCCLWKKGKVNGKTKPRMNFKPKIACSQTKASVQEIKVGDYTMLL